MKYIFLSVLFLLASCGEGLEPNHATFLENKSKIFGTVKFVGTWPALDSLKDLRVIGIKNYPPENFETAFFTGDILFTEDSLAYYVDSIQYEIEIKNPPLTIEYLGVAQNTAGLLDWKAVGIYMKDGEPIVLHIDKGQSIEANLTVDFDNIPPQPF